MGWLSSRRRLVVWSAAGRELPLVLCPEAFSLPNNTCPCYRAKCYHIDVHGPSRRETHFRPIA